MPVDYDEFFKKLKRQKRWNNIIFWIVTVIAIGAAIAGFVLEV